MCLCSSGISVSFRKAAFWAHPEQLWFLAQQPGTRLSLHPWNLNTYLNDKLIAHPADTAKTWSPELSQHSHCRIFIGQSDLLSFILKLNIIQITGFMNPKVLGLSTYFTYYSSKKEIPRLQFLPHDYFQSRRTLFSLESLEVLIQQEKKSAGTCFLLSFFFFF